MVSPYETHRRTLERLRAERKKHKVLHQRVPKALDREIERLEAELSPSLSRIAAAKQARRHWRAMAAETLWIAGALILLGATAVLYVYN